MTPRELEVLEGIAEGKTNKDIAQEMYVTTETVKSHVKHLLNKMSARNRAHAVALAYHNGWLITPYQVEQKRPSKWYRHIYAEE